MRLILISWVLFFLVGCQAPSPSPSKGLFVVTEIPVPSANLRVEPSEAWVNTDTIMIMDAPFGKMIGDLEGGTKILTYNTSGNWVRINSGDEAPQWVNSLLLCKYEGCYKKPQYIDELYQMQDWERIEIANSRIKQNKTKATAKTTSKIKTTKKTASKVSRSNQSIISSGCSCSGVNYCVGRRGGHFCITSGGNKRYLPR